MRFESYILRVDLVNISKRLQFTALHRKTLIVCQMLL